MMRWTELFPTIVICLLFVCIIISAVSSSSQQQQQRPVATKNSVSEYLNNYDAFSSLQVPLAPSGRLLERWDPCTLSTTELAALNATTTVEPCILYDIKPTTTTNNNKQSRSGSNVGGNVNASRSTVITVVGVFPSACASHRDGAVVAVLKRNGQFDGLGAPVGYYLDYYVQFRLVIGIAGNAAQLSSEDYNASHTSMLQSLLGGLDAHYILGSCSFQANYDKPVAGEYRRMVLAQVGPHAFYESSVSNEHVFGIHIPSETYGIPAFQAFKFRGARVNNAHERRKQPVRILYRDRSEFFYSTCRTIYDLALDSGFTDTVAIEYHPELDHNDDGIRNEHDATFLQSLADRACPRDTNQTNETATKINKNIALWACVRSDFEANTILDRLRDNACRPTSLWFTVATWTYAGRYPERLPYLQGGAQWHKSMDYSDDCFSSGQEMLDTVQELFGYQPTYDALGSYHALYMMYQNIAGFVKTKDHPNVTEAYSDQYEEIRRHMLGISVPKSLYGPTSFDEKRRNVGRGSAGVQWDIPYNSTSDQDFEMLLVSPIDQATSAVTLPAPTARPCPAGQFINETRVTTEPALLTSKCELCPADTYTARENTATQCSPCLLGSSTNGRTGAIICVALDENMVPKPLLGFGYFVMATVFLLAAVSASWVICNREDPVVRIGQCQFLLLICLGSCVSSSSILALSKAQAGTAEDTAAASAACRALPWLYTTGWVLQYSSLSAKSYRLVRMMYNADRLRRVTVTAKSMYKIVMGALACNWIVVLPWTILDPLRWERTDLGIIVDDGLGIATQTSIGYCVSDRLWVWLGPLVGIHVAIIVATHALLWKIRNVTDRYQESKYVAVASLYAVEVLVVGIPILVAVRTSASASYIVLICLVGLSDLGILLMIFVPKIIYQRKGLPQGVSVGASLVKTTMLGYNNHSATRSSFQGTSHGGGSRNTAAALASVAAASVRGVYDADLDDDPDQRQLAGERSFASQISISSETDPSCGIVVLDHNGGGSEQNSIRRRHVLPSNSLLSCSIIEGSDEDAEEEGGGSAEIVRRLDKDQIIATTVVAAPAPARRCATMVDDDLELEEDDDDAHGTRDDSVRLMADGILTSRIVVAKTQRMTMQTQQPTDSGGAAAACWPSSEANDDDYNYDATFDDGSCMTLHAGNLRVHQHESSSSNHQHQQQQQRKRSIEMSQVAEDGSASASSEHDDPTVLAIIKTTATATGASYSVPAEKKEIHA